MCWKRCCAASAPVSRRWTLRSTPSRRHRTDIATTMAGRKRTSGAAHSGTSPRLRGEVGSQGDPGEGGPPRPRSLDGPPHPNPLAASGERERADASGRLCATSLYRLMAWLSPAYPVGAFSYSGGIEWAVESGDIKDADTLGRWLGVMIAGGGGFCDAVFFAHAHRAAWEDDATKLRVVAELAAAFVPS